ncbi:hypothetical protein [Gimesia chilikensis]|uniref:hypothetical protein n=1 Tax=Gimesia chilikensis TaxID=2605989 RepID=UPI001189D686|nr:hypothetical protein [Gimesia chilikensis]QDT84770.1 hypothetical protein MalM14_24330 [Gimesia chilikensis]
MAKSKINSQLINQQQIGDSLFTDLHSRDVALWLGEGVGDSNSHSDSLAEVVSLPWKVVLCETVCSSFATKLETLKDDPSLVNYRGYIDIIAANPEEIPLSTRTLPVLFLNGRDDSDDPLEKPNLSKQKQLLRRLNMLKRLQDEKPRHLVVVSSGDGTCIEEIVSLWDEGFRAQLTIVTTSIDEINKLKSDLLAWHQIEVVTVVEQKPIDFSLDLVKRSQSHFYPERLHILIRDVNKKLHSLDVSKCERPDQPILDRYDLIQEKDLLDVQPEELKESELDEFFHRSSDSWRPIAARLPWIKNDLAERQLLNLLRKVHIGGSDENQILLLESESGAGGTTILKYLSFIAASNGYPTLFARQIDFEPDALEIARFLHSIHRNHLKSVEESMNEGETSVLLSFDTQHWYGREDEIVGFLKELKRAGRSVVILLVTNDLGAAKLPSEVSRSLDTQLLHEIDEKDAIDLGNHLNHFLESKGRSRSEEEWRRFHNSHKPAIGDFASAGISFWIALEFWLKRQIELGETIQNWIYSQFINAGFSPELKCLIFEIAALTIERVGLPEELLPTLTESSLPSSILLERASEKVPALGVTRTRSASHKQWILGHPQIARYLLNSVFRDRSLLKEVGFNEVGNPVSFRLVLLEALACNPALGTKKFNYLALEFAKTIFKLDRDGNREFFMEWKHVLHILEKMSDRVWETSRVFNHHVAISRRRIALDDLYFSLTLDQQREQLHAAAEHLNFALENIPESDGDDSDLNLLNSLARCYQDMAGVELRSGAAIEVVDEYRAKASECIYRARQLNATNPYVLETLAKDLIQRAISIKDDEPADAAGFACEALTYVRQALSLESGLARRTRLYQLLSDIFSLLRHDSVVSRIETLRNQGDVVGIIASCWLILSEGLLPGEPVDLENIEAQTIDQVLEILEEIPTGKESLMDLRLTYDLLAIRDPYNFSEQLILMDSIIELSSSTDYQTRLEYGILLFQIGRYAEGKEIYTDLRKDLRNSDSFVTIPDRLRYLCKSGSSDVQICTAKIVDEQYTRSWAAVADLRRERVPLNPREFNQRRMRPGVTFNCIITFGPNGPFIKPVEEAR